MKKYPNLMAEMARKDIKLKDLSAADNINCTMSTLCKKLNGKAPITLKEAIAIKNMIKCDLSLEELFEVIKEVEE